MNSSGIYADPAAMSSSGAHLRDDLATAYTNEINAIYAKIDNLSQAWTGQAATTYTSAVKTHEASLKSLGTTIGNLGSGLQEMAKTYSTGELNQVESTKGLSI